MLDSKFSRREFARRAAIASAATLVPASAFPASQPAPSAQQPPDAPPLSPASQSEAELRTQSILAQYGSRLSDAEKSDIARLSSLSQRQLDRLRAFPTQNGDDPALYLKPLIEREKKPSSNNPAASARPPAQPTH